MLDSPLSFSSLTQDKYSRFIGAKKANKALNLYFLEWLWYVSALKRKRLRVNLF